MSPNSPPVIWTSAGPNGEAFLNASSQSPGWYWVLRPQQTGPGQYNPEQPVLCPIHVFPNGKISSPLADFRERLPEQISPKDRQGTVYPCYFMGPLQPGRLSGQLTIKRGHVQGEAPSVPGWYWCRTNSEAPLLHVDQASIGPIYLDRLPNGAVHVWSATGLSGEPVDVGELGFSEPLSSPGGLIDASGELNRHTVDFFGQIQPPPLPTAPLWTTVSSKPLNPPNWLDGAMVLPVQNLSNSLKFYQALGFQVVSTTPSTVCLALDNYGLKLQLSLQSNAKLILKGAADIESTLKDTGIQITREQKRLVATDPDGHRIEIDLS